MVCYSGHGLNNKHLVLQAMTRIIDFEFCLVFKPWLEKQTINDQIVLDHSNTITIQIPHCVVL